MKPKSHQVPEGTICKSDTCNHYARRRFGAATFLCFKHYRFVGMRYMAQRRRITVPTWEELDAMAAQVPDLICPLCGKQMVWTTKSKSRSDSVSLQHWDNGSMSFICHSCNITHGNSHLRDQITQVPYHQKYCPKCKRVLSRSEFGSNVCTNDGLAANCRSCRNELARTYRKQNK